MEDYNDLDAKVIFESMKNKAKKSREEKEIKLKKANYLSWLRWYLKVENVLIDLPFVDFK